MGPEIMVWAVAAALVAAIFWDCRFGKIPNWLVLGVVALYGAKLALFGGVDLWQLVFAGGVFVAGFGLFAVGAFGAGAVKLMAAVALFMPLDALGTLGLTLLAAIIASLVLFSVLRGMAGRDDSPWSVLRKRVIPLAFPIGLTGLVGLFAL